MAPDTFWTVAYPEILEAQELLRGNRAALYRLIERAAERWDKVPDEDMTDEDRVMGAALKLAYALTNCMGHEADAQRSTDAS